MPLPIRVLMSLIVVGSVMLGCASQKPEEEQKSSPSTSAPDNATPHHVDPAPPHTY